MAVRETGGAWEEKDHPELKDGSESWVRKLRDEDRKRLKDFR